MREVIVVFIHGRFPLSSATSPRDDGIPKPIVSSRSMATTSPHLRVPARVNTSAQSVTEHAKHTLSNGSR